MEPVPFLGELPVTVNEYAAGLVRCVVKAESKRGSIIAKPPQKVVFGSISKLHSEAVETTVQDHSDFDLVCIRPY